jgi:integrase-like protein
LREVLCEAGRGILTRPGRTGVSFAEAAAEFLRYVEQDRQRRPSTLAGYRAIVRSQLLPAFGDLPLESINTPMIEQWLASLGRSAATLPPLLRATRGGRAAQSKLVTLIRQSRLAPCLLTELL